MDRLGTVAIVVTLAVVVAGCGAFPVAPDGETASPAATTPGGTPTAPDALAVAVEEPDGAWRSLVPLLDRSLRYWEGNDTRYTGREVAFVLRPDAASPDVVVRSVDRVSACGPSDDAVGYATRLDPSSGPAVVCVASGYTDAATRRVLEHEFGHLLGLDHGEGPPVMTPRREYRRLPVPGPDVRALSWNRSALDVYVDFEGIYALRQSRARRQVGHALAYYDAGAAGRNVAVRRVANRSRADVVIAFPTTSPCGEANWGSCANLTTRRGTAPRLTITVTNVHREAIGWHVGYWIGTAFVTEKSALPPPFRRADYDDRRSAWWNET